MRFLLTATLLVSASAIGYEILLMRLLSIVQWHHFAWMIISLALLGYGASGTAIALARSWLEPRFETAFSVSALLFSVAMIACVVLGQRVPFNALEIIWNPRQFFYLSLMYLIFMLPFFFAASCIGLAFTCRRNQVDRIYFFDLLGAGLGALLVIAALFLLHPMQALVLLAAMALMGSVLAGCAAPSPRALRPSQFVWLLILLTGLPQDRIGLRMSEFKGQSQALAVVDSRVLAETSSPLGLLTVVESPRIPFHHAPGLSLNTGFLPPQQLAVFTDGEGISAITRFDGDQGGLGYLGDVTAALPYHLLQDPSVLILGAGAGSDVLLALHNGAAHVDAVELNRQMAALVSKRFASFAGQLYEHPRVELHIGEARGFVARSHKRYDLIQVGLLDSFAVSGSGVQALNENHLYTVEAVSKYLDRLEPGGLLAVTRWLKLPPRDSLKLTATMIEALREMGVVDPGQQIAVIRSWNTVTLLAKNGLFSEGEVTIIREFARSRSFDTAWYPSMPLDQANRFNRLEQPWLFQGIKALLGEHARQFIENYKFNVTPATDNQPYFFHFFKWRVFPEVIALRKRGGAGLIEWGYLVLVATLVQAALLGSVLILLPLTLAERRWPAATAARMGSYFFLLGLAFLFVEMAFIQKFILFLSHPLYSVAVVLAGFLVFAGFGSAVSGRITQVRKTAGQRAGQLLNGQAVLLVVGAIIVLSLAYILLLPLLFDRLIGLADGIRIGVTLLLIAPLAFFMGMPFPLGLKLIAERAPDFIPWAWGINGFASVISAALATLLAIEFGFTAVLLMALVFYAFAALLLEP